MVETLNHGKVELVDRAEVMSYLKDIQGLLQHGTVAERRTLLKSFVTEIVKEDSQATIHYTLPLPPTQVRTRQDTVLDIVHYGGR